MNMSVCVCGCVCMCERESKIWVWCLVQKVKGFFIFVSIRTRRFGHTVYIQSMIYRLFLARYIFVRGRICANQSNNKGKLSIGSHISTNKERKRERENVKNERDEKEGR